MFSLHLPKLTAAVAEHVSLENHKQAGCQLRRALWTEACQGLVSVKGHSRVRAGQAAPQAGCGHRRLMAALSASRPGAEPALPSEPCCQSLASVLK